MINAIFREGGDGICLAHGREPLPGEYAIKTEPSQWTRGWFPAFYRDNGGTFEARKQTEIDAVISAIKAAEEESAERESDIATAQETAGLKQYTVAQASAYIDNLMDSASTVAETKEAIKTILKRMVPYLLS